MSQVMKSAAESGPSRRVEDRARLDIGAKVVLLDGRFACKIEDISHKGARIFADLPLEVGDQGFLQHDGLDQFFAVNWARDGSFGLSFDRELPPETMAALRQVAENYDDHREARLREFGRDWVAGRLGHATDA